MSAKKEYNLDLLDERTRPFVCEAIANKKIFLSFEGKNVAYGRSRGNGHLIQNLKINNSSMPAECCCGIGRADKWLIYSAYDEIGQNLGEGRVCLLANEGISVVSDIDDTIKYSNVTNKSELLANTFVRNYKPVKGIISLFRAWEQQGAAFHYVSTGPWPLYETIQAEFQSWGLPLGTFHMNEFYWKDLSWLNLFKSRYRLKLQLILPMIMLFTRRKYILIGDTVDKDPEVYANLARHFPGQIAGIFLRVKNVNAVLESRLQKTFKGLPTNILRLFADASDLECDLQKITN